MNADQIIAKFCERQGLDPMPATSVAACCYLGRGGHLGKHGTAGDDNMLGGFGDGLRLGRNVEDEDNGITYAPVWLGTQCVGWLVEDCAGVHYAEPSIAASPDPSDPHEHPLCAVTGIQQDQLWS